MKYGGDIVEYTEQFLFGLRPQHGNTRLPEVWYSFK